MRQSLANYTLMLYQPSAIAPVGQEASHAPHDTQTSALMLYCVSPWEIAPTGQPSAQVPHETHARILLIAGSEDEAWPAEYSVEMIRQRLDKADYSKDVKVIVYPHGSHINGLFPNKEREKKLYRMMPLIGLMYKTFSKYKTENLSYIKQTEKEIIEWIS